MTSLAWGGYKNGQIPLSKMVEVRQEYFEPDAAQHLKSLEEVFTDKWGYPAIITEGYRSLSRQQYLWNGWQKGEPGFNLAAYPGTSNHGWGRAADFASHIDDYGSPQKDWMDAHAPAYGWHPTGNDFSPREAWHFDYIPGTATATTDSEPIQKEIIDMATGHVYRQAGQDTVYWQERPGDPLIPLWASTYQAMLAAGMRRGDDISKTDMDKLLKECGTATHPRSNAAQGVCYRRESDGTVFWQEKPGAPLYGLNPVEWAVLKQNGMQFLNFTAEQLAPLLEIK